MLRFAINFLKEHKGFAKIFVALLVAKTFMGFMSFDTRSDNLLFPVKFHWHDSRNLHLNIDDYDMARIAWYKINTGLLLTDNCYGRPNFRGDSVFLSAFRPRFNILLHEAGLTMYSSFTGEIIKSPLQIPQAYFILFGLVIAIEKSVIFIFSALFFIGMLLLIFDPRWTKAGTAAYILFPSVFFFIGTMDIFENIAMPALVIIFSFLYYHAANGKSPGIIQNILMGLLAAGACLIRPHILFLLLVFFAGYILLRSIYFFSHRNRQPLDVCVAVMMGLIFITHVPILQGNKKMFGSYFLSTQPQLEFFQGHNPFARGSWYPKIFEEHGKELQPMFAAEPGLKDFNEKQEMDFYFRQGLKWIRENPFGEIVLAIRKTAIYFLPYNYLNQVFNPFNALVHAGTFGFIFLLVLRRIKFPGFNGQVKLLLLTTPVAGAYLLTIIFFVGARWRYYAEPFMIICALIFIENIFNRYKSIFRKR